MITTKPKKKIKVIKFWAVTMDCNHIYLANWERNLAVFKKKSEAIKWVKSQDMKKYGDPYKIVPVQIKILNK